MPKLHLDPRKSKKGLQPIIMKYSFHGMRLEYSTGISIESAYFNPECNTSKKNPIERMPQSAHIVINDTLKEMRLKAQSIVSDANFDELTTRYVIDKLNEIFNKQRIKTKVDIKECTEEPTPTTLVAFFTKAVQDARSGKRTILTPVKRRGQRYTFNAIKNQNNTLSAIKRFLKYQGIKDLELSKVNESFYEGFKTYCYEVEQKEVSTFSGYIRDLKAIMGLSKTVNFDPNDFIKPSYETEAIALTLEELDQLQSLDLSDNPRFDNVRDLFLVGCYTALRYSNYAELEIEDIKDGFIEVLQKKTKTLVTIPVINRLQKIIDKNNGSLPKPVTNQELNRTIKEVAKLAGITKLEKVKNYAGNIESIELIERYKLISSHTARRSYATIMFEMKVPPMLIMSATGHKSEAAFLRYIRKNQNDMAKLLAENLKQLGL